MPPHKNLDPYTSPRAFYGAELRRLREEAGLTQEGLGERAFCSGAYIGQFETGVRRPQKELSQCFDDLLGSGEHLQRLCRLARQTQYPEYFADAAELETFATTYCEYLPMLVPGFLQTEAYARGLTRSTMPWASRQVVDGHVQSRLERSDRLLASTGPQLWAIVHQAAMHIPVCSRIEMRKQLEHLMNVIDAGAAVLQVQSYSAGTHALMNSPIILLDFPDSPPVAYAESAHSGQLVEDQSLVGQYRASYDLARAAALSLPASLSLIQSAAEEFDP